MQTLHVMKEEIYLHNYVNHFEGCNVSGMPWNLESLGTSSGKIQVGNYCILW